MKKNCLVVTYRSHKDKMSGGVGCIRMKDEKSEFRGINLRERRQSRKRRVHSK